MLISRRGFLKLIGAAIASGAAVPAFAKGRAPYVIAGQVASYIGHCPGGFIGGQVVHSVGKWDGVGYPVQTWNNAYGKHRALETYYDFDLADFCSELPRNFWALPGSARYPNVHTWVREQRFGETVIEAMRHMNLVGVKLPSSA
jgi:hypothetical protein